MSRERRAATGPFLAHLDEACVGSISEVFDADPPFTPRGCIAQAWSVAEVLRAWLKIQRRKHERRTGDRGGTNRERLRRLADLAAPKPGCI